MVLALFYAGFDDSAGGTEVFGGVIKEKKIKEPIYKDYIHTGPFNLPRPPEKGVKNGVKPLPLLAPEVLFIPPALKTQTP